jgi:LuxR family maltose regulon positive regulatory protein
MARILSAEGRHDEAMEILSEIEIRYPQATSQERARVESVAVRLSLAQGEFTPAARWAADKISAFDDADYVHEFESLTLIRVLIMQASLEAQGVRPATIVDDPIAAAQTLLERLEANARSGGRIGRVMEIVALKAMVHVIKQETREALDCLSQTLTLAEPEGHIRLFVDEDAPMRALLTVFMTKRPPSVSADAINAILAAFPQSVSMNVPYGGKMWRTITRDRR